MKLHRVGFTVRLVFVVALVTILSCAAILIHRWSDETRRDKCQRNLENIAAGLEVYSTRHSGFPAGTIVNDQLPPEKRLSWLVVLFGFIEQAAFVLDNSEPWDSTSNRVIRTRDVLGETERLSGNPQIS